MLILHLMCSECKWLQLTLAVSIPQIIPHSASFFRISHSAKYPWSTFRIPQSAFRKVFLPVSWHLSEPSPLSSGWWQSFQSQSLNDNSKNNQKFLVCVIRLPFHLLELFTAFVSKKFCNIYKQEVDKASAPTVPVSKRTCTEKWE